MKILLAKPRGFCAGVDRAIDVVELALQVYGEPIYVKHAIVHNDHVVHDLEKKGAVFVESVAEIPEGARAVFSAHGSPPSDYDAAKTRHLQLIDATCPLVTKVHLEVKRFSKEGYTILLVGHKGHVELLGTSGEAPGQTIVLETVRDVENLSLPAGAKTIILTQTTLSVDDTREVIEAIKAQFPQTVLPPSSDICYATTNRQHAVKELAKHTDLILVVGSAASSNTNRLVEVARAAGTTSYRINDEGDIHLEWLNGVEAVGITSGASAPEDVVQRVVEFLRKQGADSIDEFAVLQERVWFNLPQEIRDAAKQRGVDASLIHKHHIATNHRMGTA